MKENLCNSFLLILYHLWLKDSFWNIRECQSVSHLFPDFFGWLPLQSLLSCHRSLCKNSLKKLSKIRTLCTRTIFSYQSAKFPAITICPTLKFSTHFYKAIDYNAITKALYNREISIKDLIMHQWANCVSL